jgi:hypothetical protein
VLARLLVGGRAREPLPLPHLATRPWSSSGCGEPAATGRRSGLTSRGPSIRRAEDLARDIGGPVSLPGARTRRSKRRSSRARPGFRGDRGAALDLADHRCWAWAWAATGTQVDDLVKDRAEDHRESYGSLPAQRWERDPGPTGASSPGHGCSSDRRRALTTCSRASAGIARTTSAATAAPTRAIRCPRACCSRATCR